MSESDPPATAGKCDPERELYFPKELGATPISSRQPHLNADCRKLRGQQTQSKQAAVLFPDHEICRVCRGVDETGQNQTRQDAPAVEDESGRNTYGTGL